MMWGYVTRDIGGRLGVPAGTVEKFAPSRFGPLVLDGSIEPFDPKNEKHMTAPGAECVPQEIATEAAETPRARRKKK
jgi:hypothetical protein